MSEATKNWAFSGHRDPQTVDSEWNPVGLPKINGVDVKEVRSVVAASGHLTEIWRREWGLDGLDVSQVFMRTLAVGSVSGWHAHAETTDRLFLCGGSCRLSLFDGRKSESTFGTVWQRIGSSQRPMLVVVPPGVWHGVRALGDEPSLIINLVDKAYSYETPDHWRLPPDAAEIPCAL